MCTPIALDPETFRALRHDRVDPAADKTIRACAQAAAGSNPRVAQRRWKVSSSKPAADSRRGTKSGRNTAGSAHSSRDWVRKPAVGLLGLCNRVSEQSLRRLEPKLVRAAEDLGDPGACVETVMRCLEISDSYVDLCVGILGCVQSVPGVPGALKEYALSFLGADPYMLGPSPCPTADYDAFCASVKEKRRRGNVTEALVRLGYADEVARKAPDALRIVADPHSECQKDLAIRFMRTALRSGALGVREDDLLRIANDVDAHGIDPRTRFALLDLCADMRAMRRSGAF